MNFDTKDEKKEAKWMPKVDISSHYFSDSVSYYGMKENDLIRKMDSAELLFEQEMMQKNFLLPFSVLFQSKINLFEHKHKIHRALDAWKKSHPLLCAKIKTDLDPEHEKFSRQRYFVYASRRKIRSLENVKFVRAKNENSWKFFHEQEMNENPVDSRNGLLWRLMFIQLSKIRYCIIFTVHHAIIDGRNGAVIVQQLIDLIEKSIRNQRLNTKVIHIEPSIEDKLFKNNEKEISSIRLNQNYHIPHENRIPKELKSQDGSSSRTKYKCFKIEPEKMKKLYEKAKDHGTKLAGCFNIVTALAYFELYKQFKCEKKFTECIYFHMLANLRPFLNIDNLTMGFWPVPLNGHLNTETFMDFTVDKNFLTKYFWQMAKKESDSIHDRISHNELFENAKLSSALLDLIDNDFKFENGAVHFAMSNLGKIAAYKKFDLFKIEEIYFSVSCAENRWSSVNFHGLCTFDDTLCWSFSYNSKYFDERIIEILIEKILFIIDSIIY